MERRGPNQEPSSLQNRDYVRGKHPPACTCVSCVPRRQGEKGKRVSRTYNNSTASIRPNKRLGAEQNTTKGRKRTSLRLLVVAILLLAFISCVILSDSAGPQYRIAVDYIQRQVTLFSQSSGISFD